MLTSNTTYVHEIENALNYAYMSTFYIGSSQQPMKLVLDTGSSLMWVQGDECPASECSGESFDSSKSTTFTPSSTIEEIVYGMHVIRGYVVQDQVSWDLDQQNLSISNMTFIDVYTADEIDKLSSHGLVGLGPTSISGKYKTIIQEMYERGLIEKNMFSLHLKLQEHDSKIWLGGYDR